MFRVGVFFLCGGGALKISWHMNPEKQNNAIFFCVYVENFGFEFEMKIEIAQKNAHEKQLSNTCV